MSFRLSDTFFHPLWPRCLALTLLLGMAATQTALAQNTATLKARYVTLKDRLAKSPFGRPLYLESSQTSGNLKGDVYSMVEYPFDEVKGALQPLNNWCDIMILHLNVKECRAQAGPGGGKLLLAVGRKFDQPSKDTYKLTFNYRVAPPSTDYLEVNLTAAKGPFGTRNYSIRLEATPIDSRRSFIHMSYSYGYGFAARMAMRTYLATLGRKKVGFTITGHRDNGQPAYIGGILGLVERNTMRYYLAIDAYLVAHTLAPAGQTEKRLHTWYEGTERYATQLHEMNEGEYIDMKHKEIQRQRSGAK